MSKPIDDLAKRPLRQAASLTRRRIVQAAVASPFLAGAWSRNATAQELKREVKLIVPFSAGGTVDTIGRILGNALPSRIGGHPIVVDNRPGGSSFIGLQAVANAAPDGQTLGLGGAAAFAIAPVLPGPKPIVDVDRELLPITNVASLPVGLVTSAKNDLTSVDAVVAAARAAPGKLTYASAGYGTSPHLAGEWFSRLANVELIHVPYRGGASAVPDLLSGRVTMAFSLLPDLQGMVTDGSLRLVATATPKRIYPSVPTLAETMPGFVVPSWFGIVAPVGLPKIWADFWGRAVNDALAEPSVVERLRAAGMEPEGGTSDAFRERIQVNRALWAKIIRDADIKVER
jgi:tripartite-type tricarboxylate transporter receptor subunit TctC